MIARRGRAADRVGQLRVLQRLDGLELQLQLGREVLLLHASGVAHRHNGGAGSFFKSSFNSVAYYLSLLMDCKLSVSGCKLRVTVRAAARARSHIAARRDRGMCRSTRGAVAVTARQRPGGAATAQLIVGTLTRRLRRSCPPRRGPEPSAS